MKILFINSVCGIRSTGKIVAQLAKEYIDTHAVYSKELQLLGDKLSSVSKRLNSYVEAPLAKQLLRFVK